MTPGSAKQSRNTTRLGHVCVAVATGLACFAGGQVAEAAPIPSLGAAAVPSVSAMSSVDVNDNAALTSKEAQHHEKRMRVSSRGRGKNRSPSSFVARKLYLLLKLGLYITLGVLVAQLLEVSGVVRYLSILAWPVTKLGGLGKSTGPAFIAAFQSGAVANSMLVSSRDAGHIDNRQLYTSVFVVSCLSLFAHLPTYVLPIGSILGPQATAALFGVRFAAIAVEILVVLLVSDRLLRPFFFARRSAAQDAVVVATPVSTASGVPTTPSRKKHGGGTSSGNLWKDVWRRSRRTLKRLLFYLVPTFIVMGTLEYFGFFRWLAASAPGLFTFSMLPPSSTVIIPAQALSLYNGAMVAANFIDAGSLSVKQAVFIILLGSMVTAPVRTLKHALPTYVAILGAKPGTIMAVSAQVLRMLFLLFCVILLWMVWP